jgi:predicted permease
MHVLNSLLPIFLIIALGKGISRASFFSSDLARNLNRLTYWIALPALLLDKISNATFSAEEVSRLSLILILATIGSLAVGYLAARVLRLERFSVGAFVQGSTRSNNAFIGLPVILYSISELTPGLEALATVALAPAIVFYNILSVSVLLAHGERGQRTPAAAAIMFVKQLLTNPLLVSCAAGLIMNIFGLHFQLAFQRALGALGGSALALALLSIGASLSFAGLGSGLKASLTAASIKVFIQPLIGLGLTLLWNLPPIERQMLLVYLACPTAVASYVLADIFGSNRDLAAHIIVVSTLLSAISLSLVIALGG